ncbi:unnamed protein product, partial [Gulo gulo]
LRQVPPPSEPSVQSLPCTESLPGGGSLLRNSCRPPRPAGETREAGISLGRAWPSTRPELAGEGAGELTEEEIPREPVSLLPGPAGAPTGGRGQAMASALSPPRVPKHKGALPSHYYESFLEKKEPHDQDYKKFWAGLHGCTLYFYNSNRDSQHVEKLVLGAFVKLTDEVPRESSGDPGIYFSLALRNQEIKFKVESLESREMWKGFILTVVELRVPSNLTLLPGHLYMMAEALAKEEARRALELPS